jgi:hypothetical protein
VTCDSGRDWFLANLVGDGVKDKVTDRLSWEFGDNLG